MNPMIAKMERRDPLSGPERQAIEAAATPPRRYAAGQDLVREGDRPRESTFMLTGFTGRYNTLSDGRRQISAIHVAGDFVDLHSFLLHTMDHGVVAVSDCTVSTVPHETLRSISERFPHLTRMLWLTTLIDGAIYRRWLVSMGRQSSAAQLGHLLCELWTRLEVVGLTEGYSYEMPLTQTEMADVLGLSLVHVNRVVQELRREGLITWTGRKLSILDWSRLSAFSEFDAGYLNLETEPR